MRTFFGHGYSGHAAAYPFESVYSSEKRLLMQSARDEVLALYRAAGLSKQESWKEGEDHIALELEYLQILSDRTAEALCKGDTDTATSWVRAQYNFLDVHLDSWAPLLTAEVKKFAKTDFYRGLAFLTEGFLETDRGCWKSCSRRTSVRAGRARRAGPLSRGEDMGDEKKREGAGMSRRTFALGVGGAGVLLAMGGLKLVPAEAQVRPPGGQDENRLVASCIRCERCVEACPRGALRPAPSRTASSPCAPPRRTSTTAGATSAPMRTTACRCAWRPAPPGAGAARRRDRRNHHHQQGRAHSRMVPGLGQEQRLPLLRRVPLRGHRAGRERSPRRRARQLQRLRCLPERVRVPERGLLHHRRHLARHHRRPRERGLRVVMSQKLRIIILWPCWAPPAWPTPPTSARAPCQPSAGNLFHSFARSEP